MVSNFPGPYTLDYLYTVSALQHRMSVNLDMETPAAVGDPFTAWFVKNRSMVSTTLKVFSDALIVALRPFFFTTVTFDTATLYSVAPLSFDKVWQAEESIGLLGTHLTASSLSKQRIFTLRSLEGGVSKLVLMEASAIDDDQRGEAGYGVDELALTNFIKDVNSPVLARDTSFLIANIRASDGQNEKTWRQRNRP